MTLEQNAVYLRSNPTLKVVIEGIATTRGSDEYTWPSASAVRSRPKTT